MTPGEDGASADLRLARRVYLARVKLIYELTPRNLVVSFVASIPCAAFFVVEGHPWAMPAWWLALTAVTALRYRLARHFRAADPDPSEARVWARRSVFAAGSAGALWGVFLSLLIPEWGSPGYPLAALLAAGIPALGLAANTAIFPVYAAFVLPILPPYALRLALTSGGETFQVLGVLAVVTYTVALLSIARVASRSIAESFELRFRNQDLLDDVTRANRDLRDEVERRERVEGVLLTAKEAAESASQAKSRFLAKMSHEIRTPMNGIIGMIDLLRESGLTGERRRYAALADEAARSLLQIINDILDVSRVEAGRLKLETADFDLRGVVARSIRLVETRAREKGLDLSCSVADRVPIALHGDAGRLRQVLLNLVANAVKFTAEGTVQVRAELADPPEGAPGCRIRFEVCDTGIGIPRDRHADLFEPFAQVDDSSSRSFGGAGLGLAISRQLVELMGGEIGVDSRPGEGACFWFTAAFETASEARCRDREPETRASLSPLGGHVLLVEDNPVNREVAVATLASIGSRVDVAEDGAAAVDLAARETYDVILMDCEMPGLDGYDATRAIRELEATDGRRVPIIALTASALDTDRKRALESGMDDHLPKPFTREDLRRTLARWLESGPAPPGKRRSAARVG